MSALTFYATVDADSVRPWMPDVPYLLPASSWARYGLRAPNLPKHLTHVAADCGGFVATFTWGDYKYSPQQYVDWLHSFPVTPRWAAMMDYCCEDEITSGKPGIVRERQNRTTEMAYHFWQKHRRVPWAWVPTVQGWTVEDYVWHARELSSLVIAMRTYYFQDERFRVGIGTLCRRASAEMIREVTFAVAEALPEGTPLHLWGIKLGALRDRIALPKTVVSVDSAAWNGAFATGLEARRNWVAEQQRQGLPGSHRRYYYAEALPSYRAKIEAALSLEKQHILLTVPVELPARPVVPIPVGGYQCAECKEVLTTCDDLLYCDWCYDQLCDLCQDGHYDRCLYGYVGDEELAA